MELKIIGQRLKKLREERGQSKAFVAKRLGISYSAMCSYEYGIHIPKDEMKVRIANYYGVPVGQLFYADENNET